MIHETTLIGLYIKHIKLQKTRKLDLTQLREAGTGRAGHGRLAGLAHLGGGGGGGDLYMLQNVTEIKKSDYYTKTHGARIGASGTMQFSTSKKNS